jgi:hypothetical protein
MALAGRERLHSDQALLKFNGDQSDTSFKTEDVIGELGEIAGTKVILKINNKQAHD